MALTPSQMRRALQHMHAEEIDAICIDGLSCDCRVEQAITSGAGPGHTGDQKHVCNHLLQESLTEAGDLERKPT